MNIKTVKIANCKTASIRRIPWVTPYRYDIVGEKKLGDCIEIDEDEICFDNTDRKFYKTINPKGWIHEGVIDYGID